MALVSTDKRIIPVMSGLQPVICGNVNTLLKLNAINFE
jgi:hypothetical protein